MNTLCISNENEIINLAYQPIMQIIGHNVTRKSNLFNYLSDYFSLGRSLNKTKISIDNELIGSKYFTILDLSTSLQIHKQLELSKGSILYDYVINELNNFDFSNFHLQIEDLLNLLISTFNSNNIDLDVKLQIKDYPVTSLLKNHLISNTSSQNIPDKIDTILKLLIKINEVSPTKRLIIFNNIDTILTIEQYHDLINCISSIILKNDIWFIFGISDNAYVKVNEKLISGISIINDFDLTFPSLEVLKNYLESNYPYHKIFDDDDLIQKLIPIFGDIGKVNSPLEIDSQVILKLINSHYNLSTKPLESSNKLALKYMNS